MVKLCQLQQGSPGIQAYIMVIGRDAAGRIRPLGMSKSEVSM